MKKTCANTFSDFPALAVNPNRSETLLQTFWKQSHVEYNGKHLQTISENVFIVSH